MSAEIEERQAFIEGMRAAGKSKEHEAYIGAEIAERIRALESLVHGGT